MASGRHLLTHRDARVREAPSSLSQAGLGRLPQPWARVSLTWPGWGPWTGVQVEPCDAEDSQRTCCWLRGRDQSRGQPPPATTRAQPCHRNPCLAEPQPAAQGPRARNPAWGLTLLPLCQRPGTPATSLPFPKPYHLQNKMAASTSDDGHEDSRGKRTGGGRGSWCLLEARPHGEGLRGTHLPTVSHVDPTWVLTARTSLSQGSHGRASGPASVTTARV